MAEAGKNGGPGNAWHAQDESVPQHVATVLHDIRNSLAPIRNAAEVLRSLCNDPRQEQSIEIVSRQVVNLTRLVDDLDRAVSARAGSLLLSKKPIDFESVLEPALKAVRPLVDSLRQSLLVALPSEPVRIVCDSARLGQVLQSLLLNAHRHTPEGGAIILRASAEAERLVIEVIDNGAGIAAERLSTLFNLFVEPTPAKTDSGVSLAIARNIVEMHDGRIEVHSDGIGHGARFTVVLPLLEEPALQDDPHEAMGRATSYRILVIDDHQASVAPLMDTWARAGHSVLAAHSGESGIALARDFRPDAIVIDIGLPDIDGFEVGRQLSKDPALSKALRVAVSGYTIKQFRNLEAYSVFRHYLLKPVSPETLLRVIEHTLDGDRK